MARDGTAPQTGGASMTGRHTEAETTGPTRLEQGESLRTFAAETTELRNVTVLFADVFSSTEAVLKLDPDQARDYLDGPVEIMLAGVRRFGGAIGNIQGDGVALAGVRRFSGDRGSRPARLPGAAMEIRDAFAATALSRRCQERCCAAWRALGRRPPCGARAAPSARNSMRSGPWCTSLRRSRNSARPAAPALHPRRSSSYVATSGRTRWGNSLSGGTSPACRSTSSSRSRPTIGWTTISPVGHRTRWSVARSELPRRCARRCSPTHRDQPLSAWWGKPGLAKAGFATKSNCSPPTPGTGWRRSWQLSLNSATPFAPLAPCLEPFLLLDHTQRHEQLAAQLGEFGLSPLEIEGVATIFGMATAEGAWDRISGSARNKAIVDGVAKTLRGLARRRPLLLIVEDLHDVDHETRACLRRTVQMLWDSQCCVVMTARPEGADAIGDLCSHTIRLDALSRQESLRLLHSKLQRQRARPRSRCPRTRWRTFSNAPTATPSSWKS